MPAPDGGSSPAERRYGLRPPRLGARAAAYPRACSEERTRLAWLDRVDRRRARLHRKWTLARAESLQRRARLPEWRDYHRQRPIAANGRAGGPTAAIETRWCFCCDSLGLIRHILSPSRLPEYERQVLDRNLRAGATRNLSDFIHVNTPVPIDWRSQREQENSLGPDESQHSVRAFVVLFGMCSGAA